MLAPDGSTPGRDFIPRLRLLIFLCVEMVKAAIIDVSQHPVCADRACQNSNMSVALVLSAWGGTISICQGHLRVMRSR